MYEEEEQEKINQGQRWINYELCHVDEKVIEALRLCVNSLIQIKAALPPSPTTKEINVDQVSVAISEALAISKKVAGLKPPGCEPPPYYPPG